MTPIYIQRDTIRLSYKPSLRKTEPVRVLRLPDGERIIREESKRK